MGEYPLRYCGGGGGVKSLFLYAKTFECLNFLYPLRILKKKNILLETICINLEKRAPIPMLTYIIDKDELLLLNMLDSRMDNKLDVRIINILFFS